MLAIITVVVVCMLLPLLRAGTAQPLPIKLKHLPIAQTFSPTPTSLTTCSNQSTYMILFLQLAPWFLSLLFKKVFTKDQNWYTSLKKKPSPPPQLTIWEVHRLKYQNIKNRHVGF